MFCLLISIRSENVTHDSLIFFKDDDFLMHAWENENSEFIAKNVVFGGRTSNFPDASIFRLSLPTTTSL